MTFRDLKAFTGKTAMLVAAVVVMFVFLPSACRADVTVLVGEPYGHLGSITPTGHAAVYFDRICAASPTHLRACLPGEAGAVIARYNDIGQYDWLAMPLVPYLYAVDTVGEVPAWVDPVRVAALREQYRHEHLEAVAPYDAKPYENWYELAGAAYDRTLYGFRISTTPEQDRALMERLNDTPNRTRYEGAFRNCADFVRDTVNFYYPRAIVRNKAADIFMTTPKQLAHGLSLYVSRHPGIVLTTYTVPQVDGTVPRSHRIKGATECLVTCGRYVVPLTVINPVLTGIAGTAYLLEGRFAMPQGAPMLPLPDGSDDQPMVAGADAPTIASSDFEGWLILAHTDGN